MPNKDDTAEELAQSHFTVEPDARRGHRHDGFAEAGRRLRREPAPTMWCDRPVGLFAPR
jgi:hypothetical protein